MIRTLCFTCALTIFRWQNGNYEMNHTRYLGCTRVGTYNIRTSLSAFWAGSLVEDINLNKFCYFFLHNERNHTKQKRRDIFSDYYYFSFCFCKRCLHPSKLCSKKSKLLWFVKQRRLPTEVWTSPKLYFSLMGSPQENLYHFDRIKQKP